MGTGMSSEEEAVALGNPGDEAAPGEMPEPEAPLVRQPSMMGDPEDEARAPSPPAEGLLLAAATTTDGAGVDAPAAAVAKAPEAAAAPQPQQPPAPAVWVPSPDVEPFVPSTVAAGEVAGSLGYEQPRKARRRRGVRGAAA
eukprot:CAMPEP_0115552564 /NCGR_PEP_ID=MMETSP0271-20121206/96304_1 /TAXON_ID=71861 /ORGANISM="Scrippsiella trochoidea, Strain CCMP3099" /LENGTH=140 /DNA_ID=CAMNT_0002986185 /DNA_START=78 /DNA_END=496 /DNA_ORIENTATION=-